MVASRAEAGEVFVDAREEQPERTTASCDESRSDRMLIGEGPGQSSNQYKEPELDESDLPRKGNKLKRWCLTLLLAVYYVTLLMGASIQSGITMRLQEEFRVGREVVTLGVSLYLIGFCFGPMIWGPMSELRGRVQVNVISCVLFIGMNVGCALSRNIQTFIIFRFLSGVMASSAQTNLPAMVADLWAPDERLFPQFSYSGSAFCAPVLGPLISGYINLASGAYAWRWCFWLEVLAAAFCLPFLAFVVPETYVPKLKAHLARRLRKETGDLSYSAPMERQHVSMRNIFTKYMARPVKTATTEPILILIASWLCFVFAVQYIFLEAFTVVYGDGYGFNTGQTGLAFIPIAIGIVCSIFFLYPANKHYARKQQELGGETSPEARLPLTKLSAPMLIVSFFVFGWTAEYKVHWIVPMLFCIPFGTGMILAFNSGSLYVTECYDAEYLASILAGQAMARSFFAAICPLFATQMYRALGPGWASSILGFFVVLAVPGPYFFQKRGARLRSQSKYASKSGLRRDDKSNDEGREKQNGAVDDARNESNQQSKRTDEPRQINDFMFRHP